MDIYELRDMTNKDDIQTRIEMTRALLALSAAVRRLVKATNQSENNEVSQALDEVTTLTRAIIDRLDKDINQ